MALYSILSSASSSGMENVTLTTRSPENKMTSYVDTAAYSVGSFLIAWKSVFSIWAMISKVYDVLPLGVDQSLPDNL